MAQELNSSRAQAEPIPSLVHRLGFFGFNKSDADKLGADHGEA
jgi:hypothetical protein